MAKKVLVTGGSGFIGANLIKRLVKDKYDTHLILRKNSSLWRITDLLDKVTVHIVSLSQKSKLKIVVEKINPDYIYHLAAFGNYSWQVRIPLMIKTNIVELSNLLEATKEINYKCFINTGSSTEHGFIKRPIKESDSLHPESFYGATKAAGTILCETFAKRYNKPIITFRLYSVYGPYEEGARFIPTIIHKAIYGDEVLVTKEIIKRDFIYVSDVVNAYIAATKKNLNEGIYNIGTGKQYSNLQIAGFIKKLNGQLKISPISYPTRHWDSNNCVADISKSKEILSWSATYDIKEGLKKTYEWFRENNYLYKR